MDGLRRWFVGLPLVFLMAHAIGCDAPIYTEASRKYPIGSLTDRTRWTITGDLKDPANAADGNIFTVAVTGNGATSGSLTIDLGTPGLFNMIALDHGRQEMGFATEVGISTSLDGRNFTLRHTAAGTRRVSSFLLISPTLARYIRLTAAVQAEKPWSVAEIHIQ